MKSIRQITTLIKTAREVQRGDLGNSYLQYRDAAHVMAKGITGLTSSLARVVVMAIEKRPDELMFLSMIRKKDPKAFRELNGLLKEMGLSDLLTKLPPYVPTPRMAKRIVRTRSKTPDLAAEVKRILATEGIKVDKATAKRLIERFAKATQAASYPREKE